VVKQVTLSQAWQGNTNCLSCSIRSSVLFSGLTEKDFESMHEQVGQLTLEAGSVLYRAGDAGHHIFTVRTGLLKLVQYLPDGTQRIVRLVRSTDVLGLEMMTGGSYEHEAVVLRTTELCRYPEKAVSRLSQQNPVFFKDLMTRWQRTLSEADAWIIKLSTGVARKRMANLLLRLTETEDSTKCILLSREDMGSILNVTIETASRTLSEFKRNGLIKEIRHNHFELDIPVLEAVVAK